MPIPHAVYRLFDKDKQLLYIGCSMELKARMQHHKHSKPWACDIDVVRLEWFPDEILARRAEAAAIISEQPRYNLARVDPDRVGWCTFPRPGRGNGFTCPICGGPKEHKPGLAYCPPCQTAYRRAYKLAAGWVPKPDLSLVCPRCKGAKTKVTQYCKPCKRLVNREYQKERRLKLRVL